MWALLEADPALSVRQLARGAPARQHRRSAQDRVQQRRLAEGATARVAKEFKVN
jgi:hypothetical protein